MWLESPLASCIKFCLSGRDVSNPHPLTTRPQRSQCLFSWGLFPRQAPGASSSNQIKQELEKELWPWPDPLYHFYWWLPTATKGKSKWYLEEQFWAANQKKAFSSLLNNKLTMWASGRQFTCPLFSLFVWLFDLQTFLNHLLCTRPWLA